MRLTRQMTIPFLLAAVTLAGCTARTREPKTIASSGAEATPVPARRAEARGAEVLALPSRDVDALVVTAPPESFFQLVRESDREVARAFYKKYMARGQWKGTPAVQDRVEYWAQGVLACFNAVGTGATPVDAEHPINTREALRAYDPNLFSLVDETMAYKGKVDWRYYPE